MSQSDTESVDRGTVRKAIYDAVKDADGQPARASLVTAVVTELIVREQVVQTEIDKLADHGFLYLRGADEVVALP